METSETDEAARRGLWSSPGWLRLWTELIAGLRHDVTGRASALQSLSLVASRGLVDAEMIRGELATEATKVGALARLLDAFPSVGGRQELGVSLADVVYNLPEVLHLTMDFRDASVEVEMPDTLPAVALDRGPASAALLLVMAQALDDSATLHCRIVGAASEDAVSVTIAAVDLRNAKEARAAWLGEEAIRGISALAEGWGGGFSTDSPAGRYVLTAPTL